MTTSNNVIDTDSITIRSRFFNESQFGIALKRLIRNPQGVVGVIGLLVLVTAALSADVISSPPNAQTAEARFLAPSLEHPFGTDELRRDLFSRTVHGLRISLAIAFLAVLTGATFGIFIGLITGYAGGITETIAMRCVDALLAFPGLLAAMAIITILGPGIVNVGIAIAFFTVPSFTRLARAQMLSEMHNEYVQAARALGARSLRIIFRHIALNAIPPLLTQVALFMSVAVLLEASLSFLGLGQQAPDPSLGSLINASKTHLRTAWWYPLFPGMTLAFLLVCLNLLADAINEATSPWARRR